MTRSSVPAFTMLAVLSCASAHAAITVDTTADGDDGECALDCTLREAVAAATLGETVVALAADFLTALQLSPVVRSFQELVEICR